MISVFAQTNVGKIRRGNEDHFLVGDVTSEIDDVLPGILKFDSAREGIALMVSDGMGGAAAGEVASKLAVNTVKEFMKFDNQPVPSRFLTYLSDALQEANRAVVEHARAHRDMHGMGATATLAGVLKDQLFIGQVGDSRAYLIRGEEIQQITKDQSFVGQLVEAGKISEEEAEIHPRRNIILQALGNQEDLRIALTSARVFRGDYLLLCSDGLSNLVKKGEMAEIIHSSKNIMEACNLLVETANQRGGYDNITVVLAHFSGKEFSAPPDDGNIRYDILSDFSDV